MISSARLTVALHSLGAEAMAIRERLNEKPLNPYRSTHYSGMRRESKLLQIGRAHV